MHAVSAACIPEVEAVDFKKRFIPEELTPLYYTPAYQELTEEQKLRYNQLHGLYFNEQIIFFEATMGETVLDALLQAPWPSRIQDGLRRMREEEREHTRMFRRLNRLCAPHLYSTSDFYFVRAPRGWMAIGNWVARRPLFFPLFLWLMLLQEERSLYFARAFVREQASLEPHFVETQRLHSEDEAGHVRMGEELIEMLWRDAAPYRRRINAGLFSWMLREFFNTPKRAQVRVVQELVREFPELRPRQTSMKDQMLALEHNVEFQMSLYSREIVPRTFARFDEWPEFRALGICGYQAKEAR